MKEQEGVLLVISGASGVGKSTVIAQVRKARPDLCFSVSFTTRAPRPGEEDGVSYHFTDRETFTKMIAAGDFLEYAEYVGNYYGTSLRVIEEKLRAGTDVLLDIEVDGAAQVKARRPDAAMVFLLPPSFAQLRERLEKRGTETAERIAGRMERARWEYTRREQYDYLVVNDRVETATEDILAILRAERCRRFRRMESIRLEDEKGE